MSNFLWITRLIHHPMNLERFFSLFYFILFNRSLVCCSPFSSFAIFSLNAVLFYFFMVGYVRSFSVCGDTKKKKPYCKPFAMGATDRSQMKESYKWNRVLLFRRIELLSARAREPALVSIEKTLGESLGFQSLPFFIFGQWL